MKKKKNGIYQRRYKNGNYAVLILDGKIREKRKIRKNQTLKQMKEHHKQNNTLSLNRKIDFIKRNDGGVTTEITEYSITKRRIYKPAGRKYQYCISADVKGISGKINHIGVRSPQYDSIVPISTAKAEAEKRFYRIVSYHIHQDSLKGVSAEDFDKKISNYKEGITYYRGSLKQAQLNDQ